MKKKPGKTFVSKINSPQTNEKRAHLHKKLKVSLLSFQTQKISNNFFVHCSNNKKVEAFIFSSERERETRKEREMNEER
jgi:hypothetical protein